MERLFSAYALTHTKLRNRLKHPRVAKLVTVRRSMESQGPPDEEEDLDLIVE